MRIQSPAFSITKYRRTRCMLIVSRLTFRHPPLSSTFSSSGTKLNLRQDGSLGSENSLASSPSSYHHQRGLKSAIKLPARSGKTSNLKTQACINLALILPAAREKYLLLALSSSGAKPSAWSPPFVGMRRLLHKFPA